MLPQDLGRQVGEKIIERFDREFPVITGKKTGNAGIGGGRPGRADDHRRFVSLAVALVESGERKFISRKRGRGILEYIKVRPGSHLMQERRKSRTCLLPAANSTGFPRVLRSSCVNMGLGPKELGQTF